MSENLHPEIPPEYDVKEFAEDCHAALVTLSLMVQDLKESADSIHAVLRGKHFFLENKHHALPLMGEEES